MLTSLSIQFTRLESSSSIKQRRPNGAGCHIRYRYHKLFLQNIHSLLAVGGQHHLRNLWGCFRSNTREYWKIYKSCLISGTPANFSG